jgi:hypothetical protein
MITDALRPIRFNRNRGYYFAFTMKGIETLFADRPVTKEFIDFMGTKGEHEQVAVKESPGCICSTSVIRVACQAARKSIPP